MPQFKSWESYTFFRHEVARQRRYVRTADAEEFLRAVASTCKSRLRPVDKGTRFWRAQLGHDWQAADYPSERYEEEVPYGPLRMKPVRERAREGRANPKGIPYLYLSTTRHAAMSEVRPWVGAVISVAQFEVVRSLMVVDCSVFHGRYIELAFLNKTLEDLEAEKDPPPDEVDKIVWAAMDTAFSEPVSDSDDTAEYAPTQIIAELFRSEGYDGVAYKSAFGEDAYSVALFDIDSANQLNGAIYKTKAVEYKFEERGSPHFIS